MLSLLLKANIYIYIYNAETEEVGRKMKITKHMQKAHGDGANEYGVSLIPKFN